MDDERDARHSALGISLCETALHTESFCTLDR